MRRCDLLTFVVAVIITAVVVALAMGLALRISQPACIAAPTQAEAA